MRRDLILASVFALCLAACSTAPDTATSPESLTPRTPDEPTLSFVSTPVSVPIDQIRQLVDRQLAGEIYAEDRQIATGADMHVVVTRRNAPLVMSMNGNTLSTSVPLNIRGTVSVGVGPFRVERPEGFDADVVVHLDSRVRLAPNWSVETDSTTRFDIERADVTIPGVQLSAPELVEEILNRNNERISGPLDAYLASLDIQAMVEPVWVGFRAPIEVSSDPSVWLQVEPVAFALTPGAGPDDGLRFDIQMRMFAQSIVGARPPDLEAQPIPSLEAASGETGAFAVAIPITVQLDEANRFIAEKVAGREDSIGGSATIRWLGAELSGTGDRLGATVDFEAETGYWFLSELSGQMTVEGRPDYDPDARTLTIADMDYTLDSDSFLAGIADWLLHDQIRDRVQSELVFPLDDVVVQIQNTLQGELSSVSLGEYGTLEATVDTLDPQSVRVVDSAVELRLAATGQLSVELEIE